MSSIDGISGRTGRWVESALTKLGKYTLIGFILSGVILYVFGLLADEIMEGDTLKLDAGILQYLHHFTSPALDSIAFAFSLMGAEVLAAIVVIALLILLIERRWGSALFLVVGTAGVEILNSLLKVFFHRPRPTVLLTNLPGQGWSFPSGHAMVSLVVYGLLAALIWRHVDWRHKTFWVTFLVLLVGAIGLSRLYLGVHYFSDVIGGYLAGTVWLLMMLTGSSEVTRIRGSMKHGIPPKETPSPTADEQQPAGSNTESKV
jgi:undecaprenyl-diphosphatase